MSVPVRVLHTVTDTDFGPYHGWMCALDPKPYNDRDRVMRDARDIARTLISHGVDAEIVIHTHRTPYPAEW